MYYLGLLGKSLRLPAKKSEFSQEDVTRAHIRDDDAPPAIQNGCPQKQRPQQHQGRTEE
jgi:hypothetical protein